MVLKNKSFSLTYPHIPIACLLVLLPPTGHYVSKQNPHPPDRPHEVCRLDSSSTFSGSLLRITKLTQHTRKQLCIHFHYCCLLHLWDYFKSWESQQNNYLLVIIKLLMPLNVSIGFFRIWVHPLWAEEILLRMGLFTDVFHISVIIKGICLLYWLS